MINQMQITLIKKDLREITSNKRLLSVLLIVPLVFTVVMPSIFVLTIALTPMETNDFKSLLNLLPQSALTGNLRHMMIGLLLNNILPLFFLLIPIMAASVMAASSFVGEKEKRTLETLLYSPLSLKQIFNAKILASFILSMMVSLISFFIMIVVVEIEIWLLMDIMIFPDINWLILLLLVSPAISLIAITLIVRGSAKAQTMEESQQRSVFLILPIIILAAGQFSGLMLISSWLLFASGIILTAIAILAMRGSFGKFNYETLLK